MTPSQIADLKSLQNSVKSGIFDFHRPIANIAGYYLGMPFLDFLKTQFSSTKQRVAKPGDLLEVSYIEKLSCDNTRAYLHKLVDQHPDFIAEQNEFRQLLGMCRKFVRDKTVTRQELATYHDKWDLAFNSAVKKYSGYVNFNNLFPKFTATEGFELPVRLITLNAAISLAQMIELALLRLNPLGILDFKYFGFQPNTKTLLKTNFKNFTGNYNEARKIMLQALQNISKINYRLRNFSRIILFLMTALMTLGVLENYNYAIIVAFGIQALRNIWTDFGICSPKRIKQEYIDEFNHALSELSIFPENSWEPNTDEENTFFELNAQSARICLQRQWCEISAKKIIAVYQELFLKHNVTILGFSSRDNYIAIDTEKNHIGERSELTTILERELISRPRFAAQLKELIEILTRKGFVDHPDFVEEPIITKDKISYKYHIEISSQIEPALQKSLNEIINSHFKKGRITLNKVNDRLILSINDCLPLSDESFAAIKIELNRLPNSQLATASSTANILSTTNSRAILSAAAEPEVLPLPKPILSRTRPGMHFDFGEKYGKFDSNSPDLNPKLIALNSSYTENYRLFAFWNVPDEEFGTNNTAKEKFQETFKKGNVVSPMGKEGFKPCTIWDEQNEKLMSSMELKILGRYGDARIIAGVVQKFPLKQKIYELTHYESHTH